MTTQALMKLSPPTATLPTLAELKSMDSIAARMIEENNVALPKNLHTQAEVRAVILAGWELGAKPITALRHIGVINGKTEPDGQLMAAICQARESDLRLEIVKETENITTVRLSRPSRGLRGVEFTYSQADAEIAGLANQDNWRKYPRAMRRWAAYKNILRAYCADLINGVEVSGSYVPAEVEDEPGAIVEGESRLINEGDEWPAEHEATQQQESVPVTGVRGNAGLRQESALAIDHAAAASSPACEHEATFDDKTTLMVCAKCGVVLEEPPGQQARAF